MTLQSRREYAISLGLAKEGRGKLSREAHSAIDKALSEGMKFSDWPKEDTVVKVKDSKGVVTEKTVKAVEQNTEPEQLWPDSIRVYAMVNGKRVYTSPNWVCTFCRCSMKWCHCHLVGRTPETMVPPHGVLPVTVISS